MIRNIIFSFRYFFFILYYKKYGGHRDDLIELLRPVFGDLLQCEIEFEEAARETTENVTEEFIGDGDLRRS